MHHLILKNKPTYFDASIFKIWFQNWECNDIKQNENHSTINKRYTNRICEKKFYNKKLHTIRILFLNNQQKKDKESLVSRTKLVISHLNL